MGAALEISGDDRGRRLGPICGGDLKKAVKIRQVLATGRLTEVMALDGGRGDRSIAGAGAVRWWLPGDDGGGRLSTMA